MPKLPSKRFNWSSFSSLINPTSEIQIQIQCKYKHQTQWTIENGNLLLSGVIYNLLFVDNLINSFG